MHKNDVTDKAISICIIYLASKLHFLLYSVMYHISEKIDSYVHLLNIDIVLNAA